ncbi:sensor histidine kinase [Neptuniibacter sp. QD34_54]|uniref:sensor histidine kinase n=1 Tax=Neptuniibacter sp. QD34_54 TaxID=3398208 RepID=UPI0039F4EE5A
MVRRLLVTLLFLLLTLVCTWQVVTFARDWTLQNLHQQGSDELLKVITQLRSALDEYRYLPFLISQDTDVKALLVDPSPSIAREVSLYLEQINLVAGSSSLFVLNSDGNTAAYSHWRDEQEFIQRSHRRQDYYKQALAGNRGGQFSLNEHNQSPAYFLSSPVYNGTQFSGAAVVRVELDAMVKKLRSTGEVILRDKTGSIFFTTAPLTRYQTVKEQVDEEVLMLESGVVTRLWKRGADQWLSRSVALDDLNWQVSVLTDTEVVKRNVRNAALFSFGGCIALGLFALWFRERQLKLRSQNVTRETLAKSEAQQKAIINNAQVGLLLIDERGHITFANDMALQQFAVSMPLILAKPLLELLASDGVTPIAKVLHRLGEKGFSPLVGYEAVGSRSDGAEFPLMISIRKMQGYEAKQFLVTVIDISRRKGLEIQLQKANESLEHKVEERTLALREAQEELVQAGKMAVLGRMSTAIVHELNQPLTAIRNYVAICRQVITQPEMLEESLLEVDGLTQRMAQITAQLKTYAYKKPEQKQPVSMQMVLENSLQMFKQRIADENVQLKLDLPEKTLFVLGDNARLEQVVVNLVKNAIDAMQGITDKELQIELTEDSESQQLQLQVIDSGEGIDPALLANLFDPFITSKPMGDGLGLGLAIVKSIMRDLNGDISAGNTEQGGAVFTLLLPICETN